MIDGNQAPGITQSGEIFYLTERFDGMGCIGPVVCGKDYCDFGLYRTQEESREDFRGVYDPGCARCGVIGLSLVEIFKYGVANSEGDGVMVDDIKVTSDFYVLLR